VLSVYFGDPLEGRTKIMSFKSIPSATVDVPEIPYQEQVRLPAEQSALIIVDMQNDFVKPEGNLVVPAASGSISRIQQLLGKARESGARIIYTQDTQIENDPEFDIWPAHCIQGTWGWEIVKDLKPRDEDLICQKNRYDGFYGTWLDHFLDNIWQIDHVVIVGTVSNICVAHTAASAGLRWYHVVVPADGISALTEFDQALTLRQVSGLYAGSVVRSTQDIIFENK
jgi:nicotinamidase-related amidase